MSRNRPLRCEEREQLRGMERRGLRLWLPRPSPWPLTIHQPWNCDVLWRPGSQTLSVPVTISSASKVEIVAGSWVSEEGSIYPLEILSDGGVPAPRSGTGRRNNGFLTLVPGRPWRGHLHFAEAQPFPRGRMGRRLEVEIWLDDSAGFCYGTDLKLFDWSGREALEEWEELRGEQEASRWT